MTSNPPPRDIDPRPVDTLLARHPVKIVLLEFALHRQQVPISQAHLCWKILRSISQTSFKKPPGAKRQRHDGDVLSSSYEERLIV
jgi:hypothetical protein